MVSGEMVDARVHSGATVAPPASRLGTCRAMFTPAAFPPPKLDMLGAAWRYTLAAMFYLSYALGVLVAVFNPSEFSESYDEPTGAGGPVVFTAGDISAWPVQVMALDVCLGLLGFVLIRFRRRFPLATFLVFQSLAPVANSLAVFNAWSLVSLASRRNWRQIAIAIGFAAIVTAAVLSFVPWHASDREMFGTVGGVVVVVFLNGFLALIGAFYGVRQDRTAGVQDRAANADRDRELAVLGERNRIAREMHDVLAHRISLVSMHAGALAFRTDLPPEQTRQIAQIIQENAHASLSELRSVLSTLRDGQLDAAGAPAPPQPTLVDLPGLLGEARSLGQRITLHNTVAPESVNQVTSRHAYRIVQECLTNARKHAPYSTVVVTLEGAPGAGLAIRSENPLGPSSRQSVPGAGLGLIGIRERAAMLGGRIEAGPQEDHFVVQAWLPWPATS